MLTSMQLLACVAQPDFLSEFDVRLPKDTRHVHEGYTHNPNRQFETTAITSYTKRQKIAGQLNTNLVIRLRNIFSASKEPSHHAGKDYN